MDPVAVVRNNFDAFQARDFDGVLDGIDEDWRYQPGPYRDLPGVHYRGHDGYRSWLIAGGWREAVFELEVEIRSVERWVLAVGNVATKGAEQSTPTASLHMVLDGRIRLSRAFADEDQALGAVASAADEDFRLAFDAAPDGMALVDDRGRIIHANRVAADLLALPQPYVAGLHLQRFAPGDLRERTPESWEAFREVGDVSGITVLIAADGRRRSVEFRAVADYRPGRHLVIGREKGDARGRKKEGEAVLTPRQREVLSLLASGLNGPQVAARLFLSDGTVRTHTQNAMRALGARTRAQAVAEAILRGEIDPPRPGLTPG